MKNKECCKNCKYCAEVKKYPLYNSILTKICLYYVYTEREHFILEVTDNDTCEVFTSKNKEGLDYEED